MNFSYVDQVNQNLICSICCSPFHEPVTTPCQHTFCLNCFHSHFEAREGTAACPLCNSAIELAWTQSKIVSLMVDELEVFCENKDAGCPWTGQRQLFQSHVNICHFIFKNCGNSGCEFQAFDLSIHANECQYALDECSSCQLKMERRDLALHSENCLEIEKSCELCSARISPPKLQSHYIECPLSTTSCSFSSFGCPWSGLRNTVDNHLSTCPFHSIKGFMLMYENDRKAMVKENLALKDTVKTLELRVADLNSRLQENPNSMFSEEMQVPAIFMDTLGRDISIVKAEVGQSGFRRDLELSKLRDDITLLRSTCQTLQIQLFSLALRKKTYSQADSNLSPKNSTKL